MPAPIVVAGPNLSLDRTISIDRLKVGHVHRSSASDARGGGKGVNVVRALSCVGVNAEVLGFAGGHTGQAVTGLLGEEGISARAVTVEGESRSCLTVLAAGGVTVFNESGVRIDDSSWRQFENLVRSALDRDGVFVCSGSFPPGAPEDGAARLIEIARARGCRTICDVAGAFLEHALEANPDVVTPNLAEATEVLEGSTGEPVEPGPHAVERGAKWARALVDGGAKAAVVTLSAAGAVSCYARTVETWPPLPVNVVNPVGAGDCLVAGLAWGLSTGGGVRESIPTALAMAAASCETYFAGRIDIDRFRELKAALPSA